MLAPVRRVTVRVPATSANLGPGFDCLGMALSMENEFRFEPAAELSFEGTQPRFANQHHLAWASYQKTMEHFGADAKPLKITQKDGVPLAGGLGSSSTCIVAGIAAALAFLDQDVPPSALLDAAAALEGHPDNVAPAILGGVVSAFITREGEVIAHKTPVDARWNFVAVIPDYEVRTEDARRVMPTSVPLKTVTWQLGRVGAVVRALETGDGKLLFKAADDKLHEPYRSQLIPEFATCKKSALASGASAFWISGSGATMMAACTSYETAMHVAAAMPATCQVMLLSANNRGTEIRIDG